MVRIRFDKAGVKLREAAIILAINQEPWAERVKCSLEDYHSLGWLWFNYPDHKICIMKDEFGSLEQLQTQTSADFAMNAHYIIIRPDRDVQEGWMELDI
jgi:hypothetical protein